MRNFLIFLFLQSLLVISNVHLENPDPRLDEYAQNCKTVIEDWYDWVADYLKSPGFTPVAELSLKFHQNCNFTAYAQETTISMCGDTFLTWQEDFGVIFHEITHIIQSYSPQVPSWLTEGIATYMEHYYYNYDEKTQLPASATYEDSYGVTAYFLNYLETNVKSRIVPLLNRAAREGKYDENLWTDLTGKNLPQLWNQMQSRNISSVRLFENTNLIGTSLRIENLAGCVDLLAINRTNDWNDRARSLRVISGCVKIWEHINCTGDSREERGELMVLSRDIRNNNDGGNWDKAISSVGLCEGPYSSVILYENKNFKGDKITIERKQGGCHDLPSWDNRASSLRVTSGCVKIFDWSGCQGNSREERGQLQDLTMDLRNQTDNWNKAISSIGDC